MATNPPHILIARNSRNNHNPSASLSIATETHAAAAGVFRSAGSPPWTAQEHEVDIAADVSESEDDASIDIDDTFTRHSQLPGTVKIIVEATTFWAHKEVLYWASPFFQAALSGDWAETGRPASMSSIITISQPPSDPGNRTGEASIPVMTFAPVEATEGEDELIDSRKTDTDITASDVESSQTCPGAIADARLDSLKKLQGDSKSLLNESNRSSPAKSEKFKAQDPWTRVGNGIPEAVIVLKEERAATFHDFLKFVYPHTECTITWNNVEGLMNISHKLSVPDLQQRCMTFLLTHAAGKPIKAMRIAELFEEEELYREASRFVLENLNGWTEQEMSSLSQETLLKLEKRFVVTGYSVRGRNSSCTRRNWFLERVLKLGLTQIAKEYQCCPTCPDPPTCARLLEEKWRQAYHAIFRFGPCQPSMVYRYLRTLEGVTPPLSLTHLSCQITAKAFAATLFDRMFSLGLRGSGLNTTPLGAQSGTTAQIGPRRHFLYCTLKPETVPHTKRSREISTVIS
ncbi:hypothetical protein BDM02DRAFT_3259653 [Thelephora ganbajun]|uniref:Uncharacterized protein n=1 Tax=Thelephora ganbajun TaxID=370292 RepID=A0ACB6ZM58_THEGA|nr:hypothetical protein BDM02DRAFT_3259653 [Thelephora ganbajun]